MTTDLWACIRKLLYKRTPARKLEHALAGYRPDDPETKRGYQGTRERLDLMRGWVPDRSEDAANKVHQRRTLRRPGRSRSR